MEGVHRGRDCIGEGGVGGQWEEGECRRGKEVCREGSGECMGLCMHGGGECRRGEGSGECMGKGRPGSVWGGEGGGGCRRGRAVGSAWAGRGGECMGEGECRRRESSIVHGGRVEGSAWGRGL